MTQLNAHDTLAGTRARKQRWMTRGGKGAEGKGE